MGSTLISCIDRSPPLCHSHRRRHTKRVNTISLKISMYIELDHGLVAGKVKNINEKTALEGREVEREGEPFGATSNLLKKYNISKQPVKDVLLKKGSSTEETLPPGERFRKSWTLSEAGSEGSDTG